MIIKNMNLNEIYDEIMKDYQELVNYSERKKKQYERPIKKSNVFPIYFKPIEYTSSRNNKYYMIFRAYKKKDWKDIHNTTICIYDNGDGLHAVMIYKTTIAIYPPHFFSRYRERSLLDERLSSKDVILHYFRDNAVAYGEWSNDGSYLAMTTTDGVGLGQILGNGKIYLFKTFVNFDMLLPFQDKYRLEFYEFVEEYKRQNTKNIG
ncbi:hypothetical protein [Dysgonomonas capnocytophagoides]|uniref:hypothetical protein n=1 Tax=Dysgonomonas capnocytophagoides TaxID=45254 RepID=UPI0039953F51